MLSHPHALASQSQPQLHAAESWIQSIKTVLHRDLLLAYGLLLLLLVLSGV